MRLELAQHPRHGPRRPQPLPHLPPAIDPHADEEDHEISLHPPRHPLLNRRAHDLLLALTLLTRVNSVNIPGKKIQGTKPMNRCAVALWKNRVNCSSLPSRPNSPDSRSDTNPCTCPQMTVATVSGLPLS